MIDELLAGARTEEEIVGPGGLLAQLTQAAGGAGDGGRADRASRLRAAPGAARRHRQHAQRLDAEDAGRPSTGRCAIETPRDRKGSFEPQIVRKGQRRFEGFDDKILALYSRGLSTRDIEAHLAEIYGVKVGRDLISRVTDAVMDDVRAWQQRPLEDVYPVDLPRRAGAQDPRGRQRAAPRLLPRARRHASRASATCSGCGSRRPRARSSGCRSSPSSSSAASRDILICCVDGLKGFPEAIEAIFPNTVGADVHRAPDPPQPQVRARGASASRSPATSSRSTPPSTPTPPRHALEAFDEKWGARFPVITQAWLNAWEYVIPFLAFPPEVRRVIYTTNAIEALNRQLRKAIKTKGHFPNEDAARKLIYLAITNAVPAWTRTPQLDDSAAGVQDPLRRPTTRLNRLHRKSDALQGAPG